MANLPRVVLAGGVSGGHTFPLIAVARALKKEFPEGVEFLFIGSGGRFKDDALTHEGITVRYVLSGKMRRYFSFENFLDYFKLPLGVVQSLWILFRFLPDAVFAKGASGSVPVVLAARLYRIPVVLHDSDAVAGRATKFLARFATYVAIAYPSARQYFPPEKTALMGNPVREEFLRGSAGRAAQKFRLASDKKTVFFLGGSLGSHALNHALLSILPKLLSLGYQVIHHTGTANQAEVEATLKTLNLVGQPSYVARPFFNAEELADIFALSTVVVSRAGANSISELAAQKKAAILVPLPTAANDEQRQNAYEIAKIGGAVVMEEPNLGENLLTHKISELMENPELRLKMGEALGQFYHPTAAEDIAKGIKRLIEHQSFQ